MSGSIGANRIPRTAVESTLKTYVEKVLNKFPGFKTAKISGSYNTSVKPDHGDLDLVIHIEGDETDKKILKQKFASYLNSQSDDIIPPFIAGRHIGKKSAGTGDIVITQFPIEGYPDLTVQIDNMIVMSEQESEYRKSFLDLPAEKQGLLVGLAKAILLEEDPNEIFSRLGITNIPKLEDNQDALLDRYDGHLYVSPVTEIKEQHLNINPFCIGLDAKSWKLEPLVKKELLALVDFAQPGYETYREIQIRQLNKAGIPFIALEKRYTIEEIRNIYRQVSIYFMQSSEAFGLPILECLCTGAQVFTPDSGWPMSWRLDEEPEVHGPGILPKCFTIYYGEQDLLQKLLEFKDNFNPVETPLLVFNEFLKTYPTFYTGNSNELKRFIDFIESSKSLS